MQDSENISVTPELLFIVYILQYMCIEMEKKKNGTVTTDCECHYFKEN